MQLSLLSQTLKGSEILQYSKYIKALQQKGKLIFNFTIGDYDPSVFTIPIELKKK